MGTRRNAGNPEPDEAAGTEESTKVSEAEQEQGFSGTKVDPLPNSAHSLESGPDAPTAAEQAAALKAAEVDG